MDISRKLISLAYKKNIPLVVNFELTKKCFNNCLFCYIDKKKSKDLSFEEIHRILIKLKRAGTMFLTFTGGEPFLRKDFCDIIKLSKELNFHVRVFSSFAFRDRKKIISAYKNGLFDVEVSLHGRKDTHNKTVGNNSFDITIENILYAKKLGYRVVIKTPITKINIDELSWIKKFASENDILVRFDPIITPSNNGIKKNYEFQITSADFKLLIEKGFFNIDFCGYSNDVEYFSCGALRNLCSISSEGYLYPCLAFPYIVGDLKVNDFFEIWFSKSTDRLRAKISKPPKECMKCDNINICSWCIGVSYLETKTLNYIYEAACSLTKELKSVGGSYGR